MHQFKDTAPPTLAAAVGKHPTLAEENLEGVRQELSIRCREQP